MLTIIFYYFTVSLTGNVLGQQCADAVSYTHLDVYKRQAMALEAGEDGLVFYKAIAEHYPKALLPGGAMALEIGWQQLSLIDISSRT